MRQIIKFTDTNGFGENIDVLVQVEGKFELTNGIIERMKKAIEKYQEENYDDWDTDGVINEACEYLETEGYMCDYVVPDYAIVF